VKEYKALEWKKGLADLRPLLRQMFWTYAAYVTLVHLFFGLMSLCCGDWLINGGRPAFLVLCLMLIWWCVRIWIHFFCFDRSGIPKNRFNHYAEAILVTLFLGLVFVYGTALYFHVERIYG